MGVDQQSTGNLLASLIEAADAAPSAPPPAESVLARANQLLWQYRWLASPEQSHGPFDSLTMHGWSMNACFAPERPAEIRQCDGENKPVEHCWHRWDEVDFSLYI